METNISREKSEQAKTTTIQVTKERQEQLKKLVEDFNREARADHTAKTATYNEIIGVSLAIMDIMAKDDPDYSCYNVWKMIKKDQIKRNQ